MDPQVSLSCDSSQEGLLRESSPRRFAAVSITIPELLCLVVQVESIMAAPGTASAKRFGMILCTQINVLVATFVVA